MACCLSDTKRLPESLLEHCLLDPWEQPSVKSHSQFVHFHWRKSVWKCLENGSHFALASMCQMPYLHQYVNLTKSFFNSLWPTCAIHHHGSSSILFQVMAFAWLTPSHYLNSLAPGGFVYCLNLVNFKLISMINISSIFCKIAIRWMSQHLTDH